MTTIGSIINQSYVNQQTGLPSTGGSSTTSDADFSKDIENEKQKSRSSSSLSTNIAPDTLQSGVFQGTTISLEVDYTQINEVEDWRNHPSLQNYATILKDGEIVAEINNQGLVKTADELEQQLASRVGGTVVISDTAITQSEFETLPDLQISEHVLDRRAMEADPRFQKLQELMQNRADYLEQQQNSADTNI
nr:hypothetical protein [uncultured Cohaesibacter sp.]